MFLFQLLFYCSLSTLVSMVYSLGAYFGSMLFLTLHDLVSYSLVIRYNFFDGQGRLSSQAPKIIHSHLNNMIDIANGKYDNAQRDVKSPVFESSVKMAIRLSVLVV